MSLNNKEIQLEDVIQIIKEIKAYLKSLGTAGEPYYKALVKLKFKDLPK